MSTLRGLGTPEAIDVLGQALLRDPSALLRHEVAFVFGQTGDVAAYPIPVRRGHRSDGELVGGPAELALANLADLRDAASF